MAVSVIVGNCRVLSEFVGLIQIVLSWKGQQKNSRSQFVTGYLILILRLHSATFKLIHLSQTRLSFWVCSPILFYYPIQ